MLLIYSIHIYTYTYSHIHCYTIVTEKAGTGNKKEHEPI